MTALDPQKPPPASSPRFRIALVAIAGLLAGIIVQEWRLRTPPPQSDGNLQLAERAFQKGDDKAALTLFSKLADQNNPTAQYWLAHMTELGLGVPRDPQRAVELYKKAAAQDVVAAQLSLGELYLHGDLVPPDFAQAKNYLEKAAYHGDSRAAMLFGQMYRIGLGVSQNASEAYAWSEVATVEGSAFAKQERDIYFRGLSSNDRQTAVARAQEILKEIKKETTVPPLPQSK
jgi:TPR repeat protein